MPGLALLFLLGVVVWGFSDGAAAQTRVEARRVREVVREHVHAGWQRRMDEGAANPKSFWGTVRVLVTGGRWLHRAMRGARPGARSAWARTLPTRSAWGRIFQAGVAGARGAARRGRGETRRWRDERRSRAPGEGGARRAGGWERARQSARPYPGGTGVCDDCQRTCDARALHPDRARPGWVVCAECMTAPPPGPAAPQPQGPAIQAPPEATAAPGGLPPLRDPDGVYACHVRPGDRVVNPNAGWGGDDRETLDVTHVTSPDSDGMVFISAPGGPPVRVAMDWGLERYTPAHAALEALILAAHDAGIRPPTGPTPPALPVPGAGTPGTGPAPSRNPALPTSNTPENEADNDMSHSGALSPTSGNVPASAEVHTHGHFQRTTQDLTVLTAALAQHLEGMLGSLTSVNAGRDQYLGVCRFHERGTTLVKLLHTMLASVDSQQMPVVEAVTAAGGPRQVNDMPYYRE